ncbi:MAG: FxsA family protein [Candidatus Nanohalobium sp.]
MIRYLAALLLLLPFLDFYLLIQVAEVIGLLEAVAFSVATGVLGAALIKREGRYVMKKLQMSVTGEEAARNFAEGFILVISGLMLLSPGFLTDGLGALISFRPIRERTVAKITERFRTDIQVEFQVF